MRNQYLTILLISLFLSGCNKPSFPVKKIKDNCLVLQEKQYITNVHSTGTLILDNGETYTFTENSVSRDELPFVYTADMTENVLTYYIIHNSPNMENLVYRINNLNDTSSLKDMIKIFVSLQGQPIREITDWYSLGWLIDWFDNKWLLFIPNDDQEDNPTLPHAKNSSPGRINLLNPATGEIKVIEPSMPDIYNIAPYPMWYVSPINPLPIYDPSISYAFYVRDSHDGRMKYSLWDVEIKRILWEKYVQGLFARPEWSPDGKQIAYVADSIDPENKWGFELFIVNKQGKETKITDLSSVYKSVFMEWFKWSPKGDRIAIWIDYSQQGEHEPYTKLSVVDLQKGEIINYCIGKGAGTPMWSPDGQQIIAAILKDGSLETVLVDITNNIAVPLDIEGYPVAWIKYPPLKE